MGPGPVLSYKANPLLEIIAVHQYLVHILKEDEPDRAPYGVKEPRLVNELSLRYDF